MAVGKLCKTQYGEGEVIGHDESNQMYEIKLPFGTAYMKREHFEISCGQDVLIWHLPVNYKIGRIWNLLGKKYPVNAQRKRMVSIAVESTGEAEELCRRYNNTKMGGNYVGFRFDEPRKRKNKREKGRRKRVPRPLRLLLTPDGFGRTLETKRNYNYVSTSAGVKLFKRMDCQEVHFVQTNNGQSGFVKKLNENGLVDLDTNVGKMIVPFRDLNPLTIVNTPYGNAEVIRLGRGEMLQLQLDFGTLYAQPDQVSPIPQEMKETGI